MSKTDICLNTTFEHNEAIDLNKTIGVIFGWEPPLVYYTNATICGPLVKIVEHLSIKLGYK